MPDTTPIYQFTYPCPGDTVDPADFALLAGEIDTILGNADTDMFDALNRYNTSVTAAAQNVAPSSETVLTPSYTFPVAGLWIVRAQVIQTSAPTTINMARTRIRHNATARFGQTANTETNLGFLRPWAVVPIRAAAADTTTITYIWNGTGTQQVQGFLSARLICRIA